MPGIARLKNWVEKEVLVYSDLNAEFNNIINNLQASNVDGFSASVAQMRETTDPGGVGSESLATRTSDEIERLRYVISRLIGKTYWYESPDFNISDIYNILIEKVNSNLILSGGSDKKEVAYRLARWFTDQVSSANVSFSNAGKFSSYSLESDAISPVSFFTKDNICTPDQGTISFWQKNRATGDGLLYNHFLGAYLGINNSNNLIFSLQTATPGPAQIDGSSKQILNITGSSFVGSGTYDHLMLRYVVGGALGAGNDIISLRANNANIGTNLTGNIAVNTNSRGGHWAFFAKRNPAVVFLGYSDMSTTPDLQTTLPYTKVTSGGTATVSNGVLTFNVPAANSLYFHRTTGINTVSSGSSFAIRTKLRVKSAGSIAAALSSENGLTLGIRFPTIQKTFRFTFGELGLSLNPGTSFAPSTSARTFQHIAYDFSKWSVVDLVFKNPFGAGVVCDVYINGYLRGTFKSPESNDVTAGNVIYFGKTQTSSAQDLNAQVEYLGISDITSDAKPIVSNGVTNQYVSDISLIGSYVTSQIVLDRLYEEIPEDVASISRDVKNVAISSSCASDVLVTPNSVAYSNLPTQNTIISDGITPITVSYSAVVEPVDHTKKMYAKAVVAVKVLSDYDFQWTGSTNHLDQVAVASQTAGIPFPDDLTDRVLQEQVQANGKLMVNDSRVYPAGIVVFTPFIISDALSVSDLRVVREQISIS